MVSGAGPRLSSRLETWKSMKIAGKWMKIGIGEREPGIGGCFMVSWEQMGDSRPAAVRRARATGKGREGESKLA